MAFRGKLSVFIEGFGAGWSENWYTNDPTYQTLLNSGTKYIAARKESLGCGYSVAALRVSDDTVFRDSQEIILGEKDAVNSICPNPAALGAAPMLALLCRIEAGQLKRRSWLVRGLPQVAFSEAFPRGYDPGSQFIVNLFGNLFNVMQNRGFGIRVPTGLPKPNDFAVVPITAIIPRVVRSRRTGRPFDQFPGKRLPA